MRFGLALTLLAIGLAPPASAAEATASLDVTPFLIGPHSEPLVSVRVNGAGPFVFILDTGSSHTSISDELALMLDARAVAKATVTTSLGEGLCAVVRLDRLEFGPLDVSDVLTSAVPAVGLDQRRRIQGVIGQDVLAGHRYTLDFQNREVIWNPPPTSRSNDASAFALRFERERFVVELPQNGSTLHLVPDSGAEGLVLFERPRVELPAMTFLPGRSWLSTLSERREVRPISLLELRIGIATLQNVPAVLVYRDDADHSKVDGLLPLHLFERVTFDGPGRTLTIEPR